jgi:hypothetical protein
MHIYSVFEPARPAAGVEERAETLVFVKEGFTWWGFLFGPFWLLFNALWLEFFAAILLGAAFGYGLTLFGLRDQALGAANLLLMLIIGFEGNELRRWRLERKGYNLIAPVAGLSYTDCERRFLDAWLPTIRQTNVRAAPKPPSDNNPNSWGSWPGPGALGALPGDAV